VVGLQCSPRRAKLTSHLGVYIFRPALQEERWRKQQAKYGQRCNGSIAFLTVSIESEQVPKMFLVDAETKEPEAVDTAPDASQLAATTLFPKARGPRDLSSNTSSFFWAGSSPSQKPGAPTEATKPAVVEELKKDH
jgi:hypothetical protein